MSLPWYPRYPRPYLASAFVAGLSLEEEGIYNRLFDYAWLDDHCSIPADRAQLANLIKGKTGPAVERVLEKWVPSPDVPDRLINETIYGYWQHANEKAEKARRAVETRWERWRQNPTPIKRRKANPPGPTADEFKRVDEMVEIWNAEAHGGLPRAQYAAQAQRQGAKMAKRIRANPWLYEKFRDIVRAAMNKYGSMIANSEAHFLNFAWFAAGPLDKIEALRDAQLPLASAKGAQTRL